MKAKKAKALLLGKNIVVMEAEECFRSVYHNTLDVVQAVMATESFLCQQKAQGKIRDYSVQQMNHQVDITMRLTPAIEVIQLHMTIA